MRKGEHFLAKSHFVVFDCFDGALLEYFRQATGITEEPPKSRTRSWAEVIEDIWQNRDRAYNVGCLVKRLQRIEKEISGEGRAEFEPYIPGGDIGQFAATLANRLKGEFVSVIGLLRDAGFQRLLSKYKRPEKPFLIAYETEDTVDSERLFCDSSGNTYRPEEYLKAFEKYVRENADRIMAMQILLKHPGEWRSDTLEELRRFEARL